MRTLVFDTYGPPEVLQLKEVARPEPGVGEALIEIRATAINPSDVKNVAGSATEADAIVDVACEDLGTEVRALTDGKGRASTWCWTRLAPTCSSLR